MPKKQKKNKSLPDINEQHPPGYNFNGKGTEVENRISLNYKKSVGSHSYWLPVNYLDLVAFRHDLLYFLPSNDDRYYADDIYLKDFKKVKSNTLDKDASKIALEMLSWGRFFKYYGDLAIDL